MWVNITINIVVSGVVFLAFYSVCVAHTSPSITTEMRRLSTDNDPSSQVVYITSGVYWWPLGAGAGVLILSPILAIPYTTYRVYKIRKRAPKDNVDLEANGIYAPVSLDDPDATKTPTSATSKPLPTVPAATDRGSPRDDGWVQWAFSGASYYFWPAATRA